MSWPRGGVCPFKVRFVLYLGMIFKVGVWAVLVSGVSGTLGQAHCPFLQWVLGFGDSSWCVFFTKLSVRDQKKVYYRLQSSKKKDASHFV